MSAELQPDGIEDALSYLSVRPGLWALLRDMLNRDPERRASTSAALRRARTALSRRRRREDDDDVAEEAIVDAAKADGNFFASVLATFELCEIPDEGIVVGAQFETSPMEYLPASVSSTKQSMVVPRPLHYVATFSLSRSLGLLLSEVDPEGRYDNELNEEDSESWGKGTANARPGEVYVRGTVEGGQAESIGICEVGDKLEGGE